MSIDVAASDFKSGTPPIAFVASLMDNRQTSTVSICFRVCKVGEGTAQALSIDIPPVLSETAEVSQLRNQDQSIREEICQPCKLSSEFREEVVLLMSYWLSPPPPLE